jgi:hypothetical protein
MRRLLAFLPAMILSFALMAQQDSSKTAARPTADTAKPAPPKKAGITDKVKSSKKNEGLFIIYQDTATGSAQLYLRKNQLGKNISTRVFL